MKQLAVIVAALAALALQQSPPTQITGGPIEVLEAEKAWLGAPRLLELAPPSRSWARILV